MKKFSIVLIITIIISTILSALYFFNTSSNNNSTYKSTKLATNDIENTETNTLEVTIPAIPEQELASFTTKVSGTSARKNNISICSSSINSTIIEPGQSFSFWDIVGNTTQEKGYKKAKSFNEHGKTIKTFGGGVCQVSSTIYNAVLSIPELEIIERHPHSKKVTYVEQDKDAAVAYPSSNFKFKNNTGSKIKLNLSFDNKTLTVRIIKLAV